MDFRKNIHLLFSLVILAVSLINFQLGIANMKKANETLDILQFGNEESFEPFDITTIIVRTDFKTNTDTAFFELDTVRFLTDPKHTDRIWSILHGHSSRWSCAASYCLKDSITSLSFEHITQGAQ